MSHLACTEHKARVFVYRKDPDSTAVTTVHRKDGTHCPAQTLRIGSLPAIVRIKGESLSLHQLGLLIEGGDDE